MVWKCPKCSMKSKSYRVIQKHYKTAHGKYGKTKGAEKKVYTYKVPKGNHLKKYRK